MDIREYKKEIRLKSRKFRQSLSPEYKDKLDRAIAENFLKSDFYRKSNCILCYVSTAIEVNTISIIQTALRDGKIVAVPRCIPNTRFMDFIRIKSFNDLERGTFGVFEPKLSINEKIFGGERSVCIVPGLMYDAYGYRLGYGGGYYDRFLAGYKGRAIGIIYSQNITGKLFHGRFDVPVNHIISQTCIKRCKKQGKINFQY